MSTRELNRRGDPHVSELDPLTSDRRTILAALDEQSLPISEWHLAALLTASRWDDRSTMTVRTRLRHTDLPKLAASGYITWDESVAVVTDIDLPTPETQADEAENQDLAPETSTSDALSGDLSVALNLIETLQGPQVERDLAYAMAAITGPSEPDSEAVEAMAITLRHHYLPKLDQAGVVEYDPDDGSVTAVDPSER